ncbi:unnamed protein product [Clonostachys chloroleuca]|uniref:Uncharacterized protein n=1 Tax=Clonostachys chloroleuca TaxID=1926264 RepID=A0AA35MAC8_9HYPO|nr:unnamed protein product [Clonostachys chloroleuca]
MSVLLDGEILLLLPDHIINRRVGGANGGSQRSRTLLQLGYLGRESLHLALQIKVLLRLVFGQLVVVALEGGQELGHALGVVGDVAPQDLHAGPHLLGVVYGLLQGDDACAEVFRLGVGDSRLDGHGRHAVEGDLALPGEVVLDGGEELLADAGVTGGGLVVLPQLAEGVGVGAGDGGALLVGGLVEGGEGEEGAEGVRVALELGDGAVVELGA